MAWISAAIGIGSALMSNNTAQDGLSAVQQNAQFNPGDTAGSFGELHFFDNANGEQARFNQDPQTAALMQQIMQSQGGGQQSFQNAMQGQLGQNFGGIQGQLGQQFGNTAFGGLGGLNQGATGLANFFGNQTTGGPQDFSGAQANLFGGGLQNLQAAGNTSGLVQQNLNASNALAAPGENRIINNFANREFMGTRGATSGAQERQGILADSLLGAQNQRVLNAQNIGLQNQNQLGQLGLGQIGQGQGLLGQSLQNFQAGAGLAGMFGQNAAGFEGQQFGQDFQSQQQNLSQGQQRLSNSLGLFGLDNSLQQQDFSQLLQASGANLNQNQFEVNAIQGAQNAEASRITGAGQSSNAIIQGAGNVAATQQGIGLGITDMIAGFRNPETP